MTVLAPDELVQRLCEEIAYAGGRIQIQAFWDIVSRLSDSPDDKFRRFVLHCFDAHPDTALVKNGKVLQISEYSNAFNNDKDLYCTISEDRLYIFLTGYPKKECALGALAFALLVEIAKTKEDGINTMDLARKTSQDPRSITGRIKKLGNLVRGVQTIYKGHVVKDLKFHRFGGGDEQKSYTSMRDSLPKIVEVVRNSKNGVRQLIDLKRELKFDKDKRLSKSFIAAISSLDELGYLKKVLVVSPSNPGVKIRCVKYLRDYKPEEKSINDLDDESDGDDENDERQENETVGGEDEEEYELFDSDNATQALQDKNFVVEDDIKPERKLFQLNRFYPFQNQTFALVAKQGKKGLSTMQAVSILTGNDYKRSFTKCSEYYIDTVGKEKENTSETGLVRVYDFEGKKKFYRLFTSSNFQELASGSKPINEINFKPLLRQTSTLQQLSTNNFSPLSNTLRFIQINGCDKFFWNGDLKVPANENAAPRGRKRKSVKVPTEETSEVKKVKTKQISQSPECSQATKKIVHEKSEDSTVTVTECDSGSGNGDGQKTTINIGGFSANSLKSLQRQRAILLTVEKCGGVTFFRDQFFDDVTKLMGSKTTLDKKTIKGDVELLMTAKKLKVNVDQLSGRRVMFLPWVAPDAISNFLVKEKDNKKSYFRDVIQDTDIYFFDQTQRDRFHRSKKSVERIKNFEKHSGTKKKSKTAKARERPVTKASGSTKNTASQRKSLVVSNMKQLESEDGGYRRFNVGTKTGIRALVMSAVITKSLRGHIAWELITKLFPNNSLSNLKKQWTARRIRMGHGGWKGLLEKWRRVIVDAMKNERVTMEDVETLDLLKLVNLWDSADGERTTKSISLLKNYKENLRRFAFVREPHTSAPTSSLDMSSMIQRESVLLRKCYTCGGDNGVVANFESEENIKGIVRSVLIDKNFKEVDEIESLKEYPRDEVDRVILDMAKDRQISFASPSKLQLTDTVSDTLHKKGDFEKFEKAAGYITQLAVMFEGKQAIVLSEEISDHAAMAIVGLLDSGSIAINEVPPTVHEAPMHYTTRKYDVSSLTPPLLFTRACTKPSQRSRNPVPVGKPYSHLWIDSSGGIRKEVWKHAVAAVLLDVFFNPGISRTMLAFQNRKILSPSDIDQLVSWCLQEKLIYQVSFQGLVAGENWYSALA